MMPDDMYPDDIAEAADLMRAIMRGKLDDTRPTLSERMRAAALLVAWYHQGELWRPIVTEEIDELSQAVEAYYTSADSTDVPGCTGFDDLDRGCGRGLGLAPDIAAADGV